MVVIKILLRLLSKVLGVLIMMVGTLALLFEIYLAIYSVQINFHAGFMWSVGKVILLIFILYIGWRILFIKKTIQYINEFIYSIKNREQIRYEEEQKRIQDEREKAERLAFEKRYEREDFFIDEWEKEENNQVVTKIWQEQQQKYENNKRLQEQNAESEFLKAMNEKYIDIPLLDEKQEIEIHVCPETDGIWNWGLIIGLFLCLGTLVAIYPLVNMLQEDYYLILLCVLSIFFYGGVILCYAAVWSMKHDKNIIFISTDQNLLYSMNLNEFFVTVRNMPMSDVGKIIYFYIQGKENDSIQEKIDAFIEDRDNVKEVLEDIINLQINESSSWVKIVKKLNSPILIYKTFRTKIKYWDEEKQKWEFLSLPKTTEGYDQICQLVKRRNINI